VRVPGLRDLAIEEGCGRHVDRPVDGEAGRAAAGLDIVALASRRDAEVSPTLCSAGSEGPWLAKGRLCA